MRACAGSPARSKAIERMVDADRYCIDVMHQLGAVQAALGKAGEVVLRSHARTCVTDAIRSGDERERARKLEELVTVFSRFKRVREP